MMVRHHLIKVIPCSKQPLWLFCTERRPAEPAGPFWAAHRAEPSSRVLCPVLACLAAPLCQSFRCGTFGASRPKLILASRRAWREKFDGFVPLGQGRANYVIAREQDAVEKRPYFRWRRSTLARHSRNGDGSRCTS